MRYIQTTEDGLFIREVNTSVDTVWDETHQCKPWNLSPEEIEYFHVFTLALAARPAFDASTQVVREVNPTKVNGTWTQQWEVYQLSAEEIEDKRKSSIPQSVSPRQIRQALTSTGLRAAVEQSVSGGAQNTKDWWQFATVFERNHPLVVGVAQALGVTERQLDDLFTLAGSL
jgi:hypothetical protein